MTTLLDTGPAADLPSPIGGPPCAPTARSSGDRRGRRFLEVCLVVGAVAASFAFDQEILVGVIALFVIVVPFEKLFPRHRGQRVRRPEVTTDITYALVSPLLNVVGIIVGIVIGLASLAWLPGLALRPLLSSIPPTVAPIVGIVVFDLAVYWVHRWAHEVPLFWRFHMIHHSPRTMDWVSGFRTHPFDGAILAPPFIFLVAAGFSAEFTGVLAVVQILTGLFLHANVRWRLRPLHKMIITPEFHHWHHANHARAHHTNYSVFLPVWDLAFGTYYLPAGERPQVYGVDEPLPTGIVGQLHHPLRSAPNPRRLLRHPRRSLRSGARSVRILLRQIARSTFRPRLLTATPF